MPNTRADTVSRTPPDGETCAAATLERLQHRILRERLEHARSLSAADRLSEAFRLTDEVFARMHAGAMASLDTDDPAAGWAEVTRRLERLRRVHDAGRWVESRPVTAGSDT